MGAEPYLDAVEEPAEAEPPAPLWWLALLGASLGGWGAVLLLIHFLI